MTDYLARAMEQGSGEEDEEAVVPELEAEEAPWGLLRKDADAEAGTADRTADGIPGAGALGRPAVGVPKMGMADRTVANTSNVGVLGRALADVSVAGKLGRPVSGLYEGDAVDRTMGDVPGAGVLDRKADAAPGVSVPGRTAEDSLPLLALTRKAQVRTGFVQRERRAFSVTLPEVPSEASGLTAEELDRAVERDARRYDGGFPLY